MTTIELTALETILGGYGPVDSGTVSATYWAGIEPYLSVVGDEVRFPSEIKVQVIDGATVPLDMAPTRGVCCVRWVVRDHRSGHRLTRYTTIPDVPAVDFGDLIDVDPATFAPSAEGLAAWLAAIAEVQASTTVAAEARDGAVIARNAAEGAAVVAVDAATSVDGAIAIVETARDQAVTAASDAAGAKVDAETARDESVAAAERAEAVPAQVDTAMAEQVGTGGEFDTKLNATIVSVADGVAGGTRLVAAGTSLTSLAGGGAPYMGWATQLGIIAEGRVRVLHNAGVSGDNAADLLARIDTDVLAYSPNFVSIEIGTNDISQGRSLADFKADVQDIVGTLKTAGCGVALLTIPPRSDATKAAQISAWNAWLKSYARDAAAHLVDAHAVLADPETNTYRAGFDSGDGIHITQAGHNAIARLFAESILPRLAASEPIVPLSNVDPANLLANGLLLTNADGYPLVPDSFFYINGEAAVTVGMVDDDDFRGGKAWQYAAVNPTSFQELLQNASAAWSVGDVLLFTVRVKVVSASGVAGSAGLNVNCNFFGSSGINPAAQFIALPDLKGYVSAIFTVPAGTTTVQLDCVFNIGAASSATYRVGEFGIFNLTTMGVV